MKKVFMITAAVLLLLALIAVGAVCYTVFFPNTKNKTEVTIHIPFGTDYLQLLDSLDKHDILFNEGTFDIVTHYMKYKKVKVGDYTIQPKMSNYQLVRMLRAGQHYPVKFSFNNIRTLNQFVKRASEVMFFNEKELAAVIYDTRFWKQYDLNIFTCPQIFIPDSYEFYYDITPEAFVRKFYNIHQNFWNENRLKLAEEIGLTPLEVSTLASIVEEENHRPEEKAIIAGLYINRLRKNMLLQSDPTVKFALRDFTRQRILNSDLKVDSPYNTYMYKGLPPGPIRFPEGSTIDSVLHYTHHNYLYMCAKEDFSGYHNFTSSAAVHQQNANRYRSALNKRNIKK